jgi:hypothetical protein
MLVLKQFFTIFEAAVSLVFGHVTNVTFWQIILYDFLPISLKVKKKLLA